MKVQDAVRNSWALQPLIRPIRAFRRLKRRQIKRHRASLLAKSLDCTGQEAHDHIRALVESDKSVMVCRFGRDELLSTLQYGRLVASYTKGHRYDPLSYPVLFEDLRFRSGVFPATADHVARFYHRMMADILEVDVLGSWLVEELELNQHLEGATRVELHDLDPIIRTPARPWTGALKGKRVLVVHPFDRSIRAQYAKRELLFEHPEILPEFELLTLRAVQNPAWLAAGTLEAESSGDAAPEGEFGSWFEALEHMEREIAAMDFDVAIIGCGAYGLPLAAHVKRLGRKAVHLGGITQMLFGIKGERWLDLYGFTGHNEHWVFPLPEETPKDAARMGDGGPYWGDGKGAPST